MTTLKTLISIAATLSISCAAPIDEPMTDEPENIATVESELGSFQLGLIQKFLLGRNLFRNETFGGNGRTCETCHLRNSFGDNFDFTPADAQAIFAANPNDPLFRPIDSDDGAGQDYSTLLNHALVRIPFKLPPNITVEELDSPLVSVDPITGEVTVTVLRSTPSIENVALEESLMWDGRSGADLVQQAEDAVLTHFEPAFLPTAAEKEAIAFFQSFFFTNKKLRFYSKGFSPPELPHAPAGSQWDSVRRGRDFFVSQGPIDADHRGLCATCHSGPMLDTTDDGNPVQPPGEKISNNFASETNTTLGINLPELTYHITLTQPVVAASQSALPIPQGTQLLPAGATVTLKSSDPGRILTTGDPCELWTACAINQGSTTSFFRISSLWGVADTAPYFHDNSAADLEDVMDRYQFLFAVTADGLQNPAFIITQQDRDDIIAYMNFAFKRKKHW